MKPTLKYYSHFYFSILSVTVLIDVHILWVTSYLVAFALSFFLRQSIILYINLSQINCLTFQFYHAIDQHLQLLSNVKRNSFWLFSRPSTVAPIVPLSRYSLLKLSLELQLTWPFYCLNISWVPPVLTPCWSYCPPKMLSPTQISFISQNTGEFPPFLWKLSR